MVRKSILQPLILAGAALLAPARGVLAEDPAVPMLRHAVACPPFQGEPKLAALYHGEMVQMLKSAPGIDFLEGSRAAGRQAPEFAFQVKGAVETNEEGQTFVMVTLLDRARDERIASYVAPASADPDVLGAWKRTIETDIARRAAKLPFECRVHQHRGQTSVSLDRGLDAGLLPGTVLLVSMDEEPLVSPLTGEIVGRDSPRAAGQIEVFRVKEHAAYARPVPGTKLPRTSQIYARNF